MRWLAVGVLCLLGCSHKDEWKQVSKNGEPCAMYRLHDRTWTVRTELGDSVIPVEDPTAEKDAMALVKDSCGGGSDLKTEQLEN
jgi:hypothetical protein